MDTASLAPETLGALLLAAFNFGRGWQKNVPSTPVDFGTACSEYFVLCNYEALTSRYWRVALFAFDPVTSPKKSTSGLGALCIA